MANRKFKLSSEQEKELKATYQQCQEGATKIRYQAVRLYGSGYKVKEIEQITGCSRPSLMEWCRAYRQDGVEALVDQRIGGNRAKLKSAQIAQIQQQLASYTPRQLFGPESATHEGQFWTVPDLVKLVKDKYGIRYQSQSSYRNLFQRCGFSCQRPEAHYRSRNELKVLEFEQQLEKNC
jgi:transposase